MPATQRGVYHNLKESKYTASNGEVVFFFSSELYLSKFLDGYRQHREKFYKKVIKTLYSSPDLNMNTLADIDYYEGIEKRGFRALVKGVEMSWDDLQKYALRKMTVKNTPDWLRIQSPKLGERLKSMGEPLTP